MKHLERNKKRVLRTYLYLTSEENQFSFNVKYRLTRTVSLENRKLLAVTEHCTS